MPNEITPEMEQIITDKENQPPQWDIEEVLNQLAEATGGTINDLCVLPDESGFATMSMPLPPNHWIYETNEYGYCGEPPMPMRMGTDNPERKKMADMLREAGKYAVRASTSCGKDMDFDPDALLQNLVIGMLGYWTTDGLSHTE